MTNARVTWTQGGTAWVESIDDDRITLVSTSSFAPGSRPEGSVELAGRPAARLWLKVHGSRGQDDGSFRVIGRLINAPRALRDALKEARAAPIGAKDPTS